LAARQTAEGDRAGDVEHVRNTNAASDTEGWFAGGVSNIEVKVGVPANWHHYVRHCRAGAVQFKTERGRSGINTSIIQPEPRQTQERSLTAPTEGKFAV